MKVNFFDLSKLPWCDVGEGTGLGLSVSHAIAERHGGSLTLADTQGGAEFVLTLPLISPELDESEGGTATEESTRGAS